MELILLKIIKNIIKDFKLRLFAAFLFYGYGDVPYKLSEDAPI